MRCLQPALDLAEARGYTAYPEVLALRSRIPEWFCGLGNEVGVSEIENRREIRIPAAIREFYSCPFLACFVEATIDGEVFLTDFSVMNDVDLPPIVNWSSGPHLVFSFHNHSGMVFAAQMGTNDPPTFCGFDDDPDPIVDEERPVELFSAWVFSAVDRHEARLDYWQSVYEKCRADPAGAARLWRSRVDSIPARNQHRGSHSPVAGWLQLTQSRLATSSRSMPEKSVKHFVEKKVVAYFED